jgi:hypothetical protein
VHCNIPDGANARLTYHRVQNYYLIVKEHFGSPWADKVVDEIRKLEDTDLKETDEHVTAAIAPTA